LRESCAFYGEPPCWNLGDDFVQEPWPPDCGEPGCFALATVAIAIALEEAARVAEETVAYSAGQVMIRESIAAAIRAMIKP